MDELREECLQRSLSWRAEASAVPMLIKKHVGKKQQKMVGRHGNMLGYNYSNYITFKKKRCPWFGFCGRSSECIGIILNVQVENRHQVGAPSRDYTPIADSEDQNLVRVVKVVLIFTLEVAS